MKINDYILKIKKLNACGEALKDALNYETSQELWEKCERGDWMFWLIGRLSGEPGCEKRKKLVLALCRCSRLSLQYVPAGEMRPLQAIETAEAWARNEKGITLDDVKSASSAASAYVASAYAASSAAASAYAASADAADVAADAVDAGAQTLKQCADIAREFYPEVDDLFESEVIK